MAIELSVGDTWRTRSGHEFDIDDFSEVTGHYYGTSCSNPTVTWTFNPDGTPPHALTNEHDLVKQIS